jgi:hypothetical protein
MEGKDRRVRIRKGVIEIMEALGMVGTHGKLSCCFLLYYKALENFIKLAEMLPKNIRSGKVRPIHGMKGQPDNKVSHVTILRP